MPEGPLRHGVRGLLLALALSAPGVGSAAVRAFEVQPPRSFGHFIGDLLVHRVHLELERPYRLEEDRLPAPGKVNRWLVRRAPSVERSAGAGGPVYRIVIEHQIIATPALAGEIVVPGMALPVAGGGASLALQIPPRVLSVSPLAVSPEGGVAAVVLQADHPPPPLDRRPHLVRLALLLLGLLVAAAYFAYAFWALPWIARTNGPFARAYRELRRLRRAGAGGPARRAALRRLHQAFNETGGRVLYAEDLAGFLDRHPRYRPVQESVARMFEQSRAAFFAADAAAPEPPLEQLLALCRRCRDLERGLA